ncbi:MAG: GntR family transcriptional regulator [Deltaproteobacteria bacterium]|nr:GntR family transcriptional regulator [Deltaproteobacteria bacterium]
MAEKYEKLIHDSFKPLYFQLKEIFHDKIENEKLKEGDMIPSESELQQIYGVSRATVRKAIELLVYEGLMDKKKGKGTFVRRRKIEEQLPVLKSFTEEMSGRDAYKKVISVAHTKAPSGIRARLNLPADESVLSLKRLMVVDGIPLGILHSYIPAKFELSLDEDYTKSLYRILEKKGIRLKDAEQTIEVRMATHEEIRLLELEAPCPTLVIRRLAYSVNHEAVEYVKGVYRGDLYRYSCKLTRY